MSTPLRVIIADDHAPTRAGVRQALEADGCQVVAALSDGPRAVAAALELVPDVCLFDIHMPGGGGVQAASQVTGALPDTAVVMLTASRDDEDLFEALRAGASGYLLKDMDPDRLGVALRGVMAGEAALPRSLAMKVIQQLQSPSRRIFRSTKGSAARLTSRETEVLELMADGLSTEQIAEKLFVGKVTVRTHVSNVLKKLRVPDRESAVRLVRSQRD